MAEIPSKYVIFKPLKDVDPKKEKLTRSLLLLTWPTMTVKIITM